MHKTIKELYKTIVVSIIYFLALVIVASVIHESGHAVAAVLIGVPVGEIQFSLRGLVPTTSIPPRFATSNLTIFHYAGGFTSGLILIIVYFLYWYKRYQKKPTQMNWCMGLATAAAVGIEIFEGYMEGLFNAAYMQYANSNSGSGIIFPVLYSLAVIGAFLIHRILFPYSKIKLTALV